MTASPTPAPKRKSEPVSKVVTDSGMTDQEWILQNSKLSPAAAEKRGACWQCGGPGKLHFAFGGEQGVSVCSECDGTGKSKTSAARTA